MKFKSRQEEDAVHKLFKLCHPYACARNKDPVFAHPLATTFDFEAFGLGYWLVADVLGDIFTSELEELTGEKTNPDLIGFENGTSAKRLTTRFGVIFIVEWDPIGDRCATNYLPMNDGFRIPLLEALIYSYENKDIFRGTPDKHLKVMKEYLTQKNLPGQYVREENFLGVGKKKFWAL